MTEQPVNKIDEAKDLIENLDPYKTIYYFENLYHAVRNDWLTDIPTEEAEELLRSPEYSLWSLGDSPRRLPESCPSFIVTEVNIKVPAREFLQIVFDLYYRQNVLNRISTN